MIERTNAPGLSQPPGYSHVVGASGARLVTTAGAVPLDTEGDLVAQTRQVLANLALALRAAGASGSGVLRTTSRLRFTSSPRTGKTSRRSGGSFRRNPT